jgi:hypothetical protein
MTVDKSDGEECSMFSIDSPGGPWSTPTSEQIQQSFNAGTWIDIRIEIESPCPYCFKHWLVNDEVVEDAGPHEIAGFYLTENTTAIAVFVEAAVSIDTVDICDDEITVTVAGEDLAGYLLVELVSETSAHTVYNENKSSGTYTISFDWPSVPVGVEYTSIRATWSPCDAIATDTYEDVHFMNLGVYRQSQYNTPHESHATCASSSVDVCFTDGNCDYSTGTLLSTFATQANVNGSGVSIDHGDLNVEDWCLSRYPPPPACEGHLIFREFGDPQAASCAGGSLGNDTVARGPDNDFLDCGDTVCIIGIGMKTVTDRGGRVGPEQLDNYTTETACTGILDLVPEPGAITIKIFNDE